MNASPCAPDLSALPAPLATACTEALAHWQRDDRIARLWRRDASLWSGGDEARWLGWLTAPARERPRLQAYRDTAAAAHAQGLTRVLWGGIGGSSLAAQVYGDLAIDTSLPVTVLDTLLPENLADAERAADLKKCLVVVASKSGTTLEMRMLMERLLPRVPARQFVALTDPGSALEKQATVQGFASVFHGEATVGGRYSALTAFGLLAAAFAGFDLDRLLDRAEAMAAQCHPSEASNPGLALGLLLGCAARQGRNKLLLLSSPRMHTFALWIEQLVAESTGKAGQGIVPVVAPPGASLYDTMLADQVVVRLGLRGDAPPPTAPAGAVVVDFMLDDAHDLGAEFFRWMFATAVAGAVLGVHPFDQPDVEAAKTAARKYLDGAGASAVEAPAQTAPVQLMMASGLKGQDGGDASRAVAALVQSLQAGDHLALLCWLPDATASAVSRLQQQLAKGAGIAVSTGFGPRYLHSSGQLHKGGPAHTACLMLTLSRAPDAEWRAFAEAVNAQARGDAETLAARGRRLVWVQLAGPLDEALSALTAAAVTALKF
jgi:transaldolase/glucose-6-phosphate isomerase